MTALALALALATADANAATTAEPPPTAEQPPPTARELELMETLAELTADRETARAEATRTFHRGRRQVVAGQVTAVGGFAAAIAGAVAVVHGYSEGEDGLLVAGAVLSGTGFISASFSPLPMRAGLQKQRSALAALGPEVPRQQERQMTAMSTTTLGLAATSLVVPPVMVVALGAPLVTSLAAGTHNKANRELWESLEVVPVLDPQQPGVRLKGTF